MLTVNLEVVVIAAYVGLCVLKSSACKELKIMYSMCQKTNRQMA